MGFMRAIRRARANINDYEHFKNVWGPHKNDADKELGTAQNAFKTLEELGTIINADRCDNWRQKKDYIFRHICRNDSLHKDILALSKYITKHDTTHIGDPDDVAHIMPPAHRIGYAIYTSKDGTITKERIEGLDKTLEVLRDKKKRIIATQTLFMLRHESYRGRHII